MNITTTHKSNVNGRGQIVAKGHGRQRTVSFDHSQSNAVNHAEAVAALVRAEEERFPGVLDAIVAGIDNGTAKHEVITTDKHVWTV